jgi:hypothetical protein
MRSGRGAVAYERIYRPVTPFLGSVMFRSEISV